ncbi:MAG TPA: TniQ family protein [Anaerolineales bacterium]
MAKESIISLVLRVARLNYYNARDIFELLLDEQAGMEGARRYTEVCYPQDYKTICRWSEYLGIEPEALLDASNQHFASLLATSGDLSTNMDWLDGNPRRAWMPRKRQPHLTSSFSARYCPICLRASPYHRLNWIPMVLSICTEHHCLLLDVCPHCRKHISVQEVLDRHCRKCGTNLCDAEIVSVENDNDGIICQMTSEYWFGLSGEAVVTESYGHPKLCSALAYHFTEALYHSLSVLEDPWRNFPPSSHVLINATSPYTSALHNYLLHRAAFASLLNWPHGLFDFLDAYGNSGPSPKFERNLARIWLRLSHLAKNIPESSFIMQEIVNYSLERNIPIPGFILSVLGNEQWFSEQTGSVSPDEAFSALGIDTTDLDRLPIRMRQELLRSQVPSFLNRDMVRTLREKWQAGWSVTETAYWLGLDSQTVRELVELGELSIQQCKNDDTYSINHKSAQEFFQKVATQLASSYAGTNQDCGFLPLDAVRTLGLSRKVEAKLLQCVERGCIPALWPATQREWKIGKIGIPFEVAHTLINLLLLEHQRSQPGASGIPDASMLAKPMIVECETLQGYFERFGRANHLEQTDWAYLFDLPWRIGLNYVTNSGSLMQIADFLGIPMGQVKAMTVHRFAPQIIGLDWWDEKDSDSFLTDGKSLRICPYCYAETQTSLLRWLIRPVTACEKHRVLLLDRCSVCGARLSNESRCMNCHTLVTDMDVIAIDDHDLASVMFIDFVSKAIHDNDPLALKGEVFPFSSLDARQFFSTILKLGALLLEYDRTNPRLDAPRRQVRTRKGSKNKLKGLSNLAYHRTMSAAVEILLDWPQNWHAALQRILIGNKINMNNKATLRKRSAFPLKLQRLLESEGELIWLWEEFQEFVQSKGQGLPGIEEWQSYLSDTGAKLKICMSFHDPRDPSRTGLEEQEILTFNQALDYLALKRDAFNALIERGLIVPQESTQTTHGNEWFFGRSHLDRAVTYLVGHLAVRDFYFVDEEIVQLNDALKFANNLQIQWIDILSAVHCQQIGAFRQPGILGFQAVWMPKYELERYRRNAAERTLLSVQATMDLLHCKLEVLADLANAGVLRPCRGYPGKNVRMWQYDQDSICDFLERYVKLGSAGKIFGCSANALRKWAENGWIKAISVPGDEDTDQYRVDSRNPLQWEYEGLVSMELCEVLGISQHSREILIAKNKIQRGFVNPR